jgi:hypothetical protein
MAPDLGATVPGDERATIEEVLPPPRTKRWIPAATVGIVALTASVAALMTPRANAPQVASQQGQGSAVNPKEIVKAPPLAPALATAGKDKLAGQSMGASAACDKCGTVQMVVAVHGYGQDKASGYQMHIRMDDGSTRTVEQRGALPAGSRVVLDGGSLRVLSPRPGQG